MSVLIIHRHPFEPFPYRAWLDSYDGPLVVLADASRFAPAAEEVPAGDQGFARLELLDSFADEDLVLRRALALAEEFGTTHVVAHHEADLHLAAAVRERLGLTGAWPADVTPFRDKLVMKRLASAAGVPVADHAPARTPEQVRDFAAGHGFPVVLKDRSGYSSMGLQILRDDAELTAALARTYPPGATPDLIVEGFVPGRMCHVDGLVVNGRMVAGWASEYQYDLASFGTDHGPRIDLTLDAGDPLSVRLLELAGRAVAALKAPDGRLDTHAFHAEVFHTPDDRLVLCEVACRPGGAKIREVAEVLFGFNLGDYTTRAQVGLPLPLLAGTLAGGALPAPARMAGQLIMMKRPGPVRQLPQRPRAPWVERFWLYAREHQVVAPASGSSDFLLAAVGSAPTRAECERRMRALGERLRSEVIAGGPADDAVRAATDEDRSVPA